MLLLSILLAATVTTTQPAVVPKCQITGTVEEANLQPAFEVPCVKTNNCPANFQGSWPEGYLVKLKINSIDSMCSVLTPKDSTTSVFISKAIVKKGDSFSKGMNIEGLASYKEMVALESYKIVAPEKQSPSIPTAQAVPNKESFFSWLINAIKRLFGGK